MKVIGKVFSPLSFDSSSLNVNFYSIVKML